MNIRCVETSASLDSGQQYKTMERTPSTERSIPIEIIGHVSDVSEDEIDIDNFVENMNSKIIISKPPKSDKSLGDNETSSSNRASLIITHEDGSTEENECTVTCLGVSSDSRTNPGLQIEEISQDTLKDKLADEKLKVVIPDMSQVIILEADEVTDASFVSTPEVEESRIKPLENDLNMTNIRFEKEEVWTTPGIPYSIIQKGHEDNILIQNDGKNMQQKVVEGMNPSDNENNKIQNLSEYINTENAQAEKMICDANTMVVETSMSVEDKSLIDLLGNAKIEQEMNELKARPETAFDIDEQHSTYKSRKSSHEICKFVQSKENEAIAIADSQSDEAKDIEVQELKINLGNEGSSEDIKENNLSRHSSNESNVFEQKAMFIEPIKKDLNLESKSEEISADEVEDQIKLPMKKLITETVRIIPITLPDGKSVERGIFSDHPLIQNKYTRNLSPDINPDCVNPINKDKHDTASTIPIHMEPSTLKQEGAKDTTDKLTVEGNEDSGNNAESFSSPLITKSIQPIETVSATKCIEQNNQTVKSKDISRSFSTLKQEGEKEKTDKNTIEGKEDFGNNAESFSSPLITKSIQSTETVSETKCIEQNNERVESEVCNFETKESKDAPTINPNQIPGEVKQDFSVKDEQKQSTNEIENDSILTDPLKDRTILKQKENSTHNLDELEVKTINTICVKSENLDKIQQTEWTQQGNTCSDATSKQLAKDAENKIERNFPIFIQTVSENKSENINEKTITSKEVSNSGKNTRDESTSKIISSLSTDSLISKVSSEETKIDNYQIPRDNVSGESSVQNEKGNVDYKTATNTDQVSGRRVSIEPKYDVKSSMIQKDMKDYLDIENKTCFDGTQKKSTCSSESYIQSCEPRIVENKQIRNIPIKIEANSEDESENIHKNESKDNLQATKSETEDCDKFANFEENCKTVEGSSLELKFQRDENPPLNFATASPISPVVRTIPIQMIGCTSVDSQDKQRNNNVETKSNNYEQIQLNIPIQRVVEHKDCNTTLIDKRRESKKQNYQSENSEAQKVDSMLVEDTKALKRMKESEMNCKTKQEDIPSHQQGVLSVPIKIELQDGTLKINSEKEENTESESGEMKKVYKNSLDTCSPIILNRKQTELEPEKDSCMSPSKSPPPPPLPTSKPPASVRTIPILRQSLSDSGEGMTKQRTTARQRNKSEQSTRGDILQKVHQELEEARAKLTAQANSLSSGLENMPKTGFSKNDPRSRSVESEQRCNGARPKDGKPRNLFKRERSLQDIDKDIETIWKELQELDKPDMHNNTDRRNRNPSRAQTPLFEQVLVTPSWRTPTPPLQPSQSVRASLSNPIISNPITKQKQPLPRTTSPHTIWDTQNTGGAMNERPSSGQLSSSWDSVPQYFPTKPSTHFGFLPKAETKPGNISPSYVSQTNQSGSAKVRSIPIERSDPNSTKLDVQLPIGKEFQSESIKTKNITESSRIFKSEESLKSCLKSDASNFTIHSLKKRSQSPSNVKFSNKHKSAENIPKPNGRNSEPDPPFEWVDFRKADGEIVKGTILPPLHRDNDVILSREVPILNVLLDDAMKEDTKPEEKNQKIMMEKEPKIESLADLENRDKNVVPTAEIFNACDAGTQTEKSEKKNGCHIM